MYKHDQHLASKYDTYQRYKWTRTLIM